MTEPGSTSAIQPTPPPQATKEVAYEYIYLLHEREFLHSNRPLYKIGRTAQSPNDRFSDYPKGSVVIMFLRVTDSKATEKTLKAVFKQKFKQDRDIGIEYFEGDVNEMVKQIFLIVTKLSSITDENERLKQTVQDLEQKIVKTRDSAKELLTKFVGEMKDVLEPKKEPKEKAATKKKGVTEGNGEGTVVAMDTD